MKTRCHLIALILLTLCLAGCGQDKEQVRQYLDSVDASEEMMRATVSQMQSSMDELKAEYGKGNVDTEQLKSRLGEFEEQMVSVKDKVANLPVPKAAKAHHEMTVKRYESVVAVLQETRPMLDLAAQVSQVEAQMKKTEDPEKLKGLADKARAAGMGLLKHRNAVMKLAEEGQKLEAQAKQERLKLVKEYNLPLPSSTATPVPAGTP